MQMEQTDLKAAADRVYRYLMFSNPESWGGHEWAEWAMDRNRWDWPGARSAAVCGEAADDRFSMTMSLDGYINDANRRNLVDLQSIPKKTRLVETDQLTDIGFTTVIQERSIEYGTRSIY
ncbi:hypothetical protein BK138_00190 [Paenibacillus rhizosphaerae]|uniref:Uncharacterized protein n=2 Tax=Paenibacillus TaxID=44249 RepID=A0A1R1EZ44_9BACL|nr:hypothetical protein BK138_00190 [Paenibacillus rhizosphaerae]